MQTRASGLDIYRVLCCIGVLIYHIVDDVLVKSQYAVPVYFAASFCVPGFFLLSGYLLGMKDEVSLEYCENKIIDTLKKLFLWIVFWTIVHFMLTGEIMDLWENLSYGMASQGVLPVSWFLFTYVFILIFAYPLHILLKKYPVIFVVITVVWTILLALGFGKTIIYSKSQSCWIHLYLGYFVIGMSLAWLMNIVKKHNMLKVFVLVSAIIFVISFIMYLHSIRVASEFRFPHEYYGTWLYSVWIISGFITISSIDIKSTPITHILKLLSNNTFVVYLGHLPILLFVTEIMTIDSLKAAVTYVVVFFIGLEIFAEILKRLPVLRKLV